MVNLSPLSRLCGAFEDLAEYTHRLTEFSKTWHFRNVLRARIRRLSPRQTYLNMKEEAGATKMRAIVEETLEMVRQYKGSPLVSMEWNLSLRISSPDVWRSNGE